MTDIRNNRGHSRKLKIGVGGQPVVSHALWCCSIYFALCFDSKNLKSGVNSHPQWLCPQQSWQNEVELQPTSSLARVTSEQNTSSHSADVSRHPVAEGTAFSKQTFAAANPRGRKLEATAFPAFHSKNAPVKVSVTGEWALKECQVHNYNLS